MHRQEQNSKSLRTAAHYNLLHSGRMYTVERAGPSLRDARACLRAAIPLACYDARPVCGFANAGRGEQSHDRNTEARTLVVFLCVSTARSVAQRREGPLAPKVPAVHHRFQVP